MSESKGFYLWLSQFVVLLGLIALFLWLSLIPKHPNYTIINLYVPSLDGTQNSSSSMNTNSTDVVQFLLEIKNPNKDSGIYYDDTIITLFWGDENAGTMTISSFYQGHGRTAQYQTSIYSSSSSRPGPNSSSWDAMRRRREMKVQAATKVRYKTWGVKSKHHGITMQGKVRVGPDGKISGKKKKIKLHRTRKKWRRILLRG